MPPQPSPLQRIALVVVSLALPALMLVITAGCFFVLTSMGNHDRTLVWVQGTPAQLAELERSVTRHPVFRHGRVQAGGFDRHRPDSCDPRLVSASFSRLHDYEVLVAKATLDQLVRDAGTTPCRAHAFVFNDLPNPLDPTEWDESVASMLLMLLLPTGSLLVAYWSCSSQFGLPRLFASRWPPGRSVATALALAVLALAWATLTGWLQSRLVPGAPAPPDSFRMPSFSLAMLVVAALYAPFLEEVAFRGWLVPIAERALGTGGAIALSALAFASLQLGNGLFDALAALGLGAGLAMLFARSRSVPACLLAHGAFNAAALAWTGLAAA